VKAYESRFEFEGAQFVFRDPMRCKRHERSSILIGPYVHGK
jgi:hypothetical protein